MQRKREFMMLLVFGLLFLYGWLFWLLIAYVLLDYLFVIDHSACSLHDLYSVVVLLFSHLIRGVQATVRKQ